MPKKKTGSSDILESLKQMDETGIKQNACIFYMITEGEEIPWIADKLKISQHKIKEWLKDPTFRMKYDKQFERVTEHHAKDRINAYSHLWQVYIDKAVEKIEKGELDTSSPGTLINQAIKLSNEIRVDKGETTENVKVNIVDELKDQYVNSELKQAANSDLNNVIEMIKK